MELTQTPLRLLADKIKRLKPVKESQKVALNTVLNLIICTPYERGADKSLLEYEDIVLEQLYNTCPKTEPFIFKQQKQQQMADQQDDFKIEIEDVPLGSGHRPSAEDSKYWPYIQQLNPGQSFTFPAADYNKMSGIISFLKLKQPEKKFGIRTLSASHKRFGRIS